MREEEGDKASIECRHYLVFVKCLPVCQTHQYPLVFDESIDPPSRISADKTRKKRRGELMKRVGYREDKAGCR